MKVSVSLVTAAAVAVFCMSGISYASGWKKYDKPVPTKVIVRVLAHGAKSMNQSRGARVQIKDATTNAILTEGDLQGSTGDTTALMKVGYPRIRGQHGLLKGQKGFVFEDLKADEKAREKNWKFPEPYYDVRDERKTEDLKPLVYESEEDSAKFEATLDLDEPKQVFIEVQGPLMPHHAAQLAVVSTWLFPGVDVTGEGIVLELRGLIVDALASLKESEYSVSEHGNDIEVSFNMSMMCGCPIVANQKSGIPWEAEGIDITMRAFYKGKMYFEDEFPASKVLYGTSWFLTKVPVPDDLPEGQFNREQVLIRILASQPDQNNFGFDEFSMYLKN